MLASIPEARAFGPSGTSVAIGVTTSPTLLVSPSDSIEIYVTSSDVGANSAGNFSLVYGSTISAPCDTGTMAMTGAYNFAAQSDTIAERRRPGALCHSSGQPALRGDIGRASGCECFDGGVALLPAILTVR